MKSKIIETEERVFIENIPRLKWNENNDNSFIRSTQFVLNSLGENFSYDYLMGISGAAFRLHFNPDWCPSSADSTTGFDVSKVLFKSLGYDCELCSIDDNSFEEIKSLYRRIITQINIGYPIIAINLRVCPEWGIMVGYLKNQPGILCRTFFDDTDDYSLAQHAPWLSFFIRGKGERLDENELFHNSLRIAVELAKTEKYGYYKSGFAAFSFWIGELSKFLDSDKNNYFKEHEVNLTIWNYLLDSRRAASCYLGLMAENLIDTSVLENYEKEYELLKTATKDFMPSFGDNPKSWSKEIIRLQLDVLKQVFKLEQESIVLLEKEIS